MYENLKISKQLKEHSMEMLIGDKKELLAQLKTKDNAVHVGHSLL